MYSTYYFPFRFKMALISMRLWDYVFTILPKNSHAIIADENRVVRDDLSYY